MVFFLRAIKYIFIFHHFTTMRVERTHLSYYIGNHSGCWWPGDTRSKGINNHDIDIFLPEYSGFSSAKLLIINPGDSLVLFSWQACL